MKIAIAGYGVEGEASYQYFSKNRDNDITIVDENKPSLPLPQGVKTIIGDECFSKLQGFDLVVRTAGLAPYKIKTDGKVWSATNEFFDKCPCTIIGVTGSKGKGTTASLIASILEAAGDKVWLLGNIGTPALNVLDNIKPNDIVVYELSSFQLWDLQKSPHIAVVLFIEIEHQDVHRGLNEYVAAKSNITLHQTLDDTLIYNINNEHARRISESSKAHLIGYLGGNATHVKDGYFWHGEQKICSVRAIKLVGLHNQDNACAAIEAAWQFTQNPKIIEKGLGEFKGLPHRLQFVRKIQGVRYYDDSIATTPSSAIAALRSFGSEHKVIILGGSYKGSDFSELANEMKKQDAYAILIGDEAKRIADSFIKANFSKFEIIENVKMSNIVKRVQELSKGSGIVLLSPAAASFGLFKNYIDRGNQFIQAVKKLEEN